MTETASSGQEQPILRIIGAVRRFGKTTAVDDITLDIHRGEFFALLGPSGCGKTTLLRLIAGFEQLDEGQILLDGEDIASLPPHKRPVNTVFQHFALFPHLTVHENVAFGLRRQKRPDCEIRVRVDESLALVRLEGFGQRMPAQLSGGQRQRVALARALVPRPRVLLLDEPLGALDHQLRLHMQVELKQLQRACGITFLFVTHDQPEALAMSDRIAVLSSGRVQQYGPGWEIYEQPRNEFVARFMGASNLLPADVTETAAGEARVSIHDGPECCVEVIERASPRLHETVRIMLRPEWLSLSRTPPDSADWNAWSVRVLDRSYLGSTTRWTVEGLGAGPLEVWTGSAKVASGPIRSVDDVSPGEDCFLVWRNRAGVLLRVGEM